MNLREAAEKALEALDSDNPDVQLRAAIALRTALAEAEEPVAWIGTSPRTGQFELCKDKPAPSVMRDFRMGPLYAHPPRREPLTEEQIRDLWSWASTHEAEKTATTQQHAFARAIERAHGIGGDE